MAEKGDLMRRKAWKMLRIENASRNRKERFK